MFSISFLLLLLTTFFFRSTNSWECGSSKYFEQTLKQISYQVTEPYCGISREELFNSICNISSLIVGPNFCRCFKDEYGFSSRNQDISSVIICNSTYCPYDCNGENGECINIRKFFFDDDNEYVKDFETIVPYCKCQKGYSGLYCIECESGYYKKNFHECEKVNDACQGENEGNGCGENSRCVLVQNETYSELLKGECVCMSEYHVGKKGNCLLTKKVLSSKSASVTLLFLFIVVVVMIVIVSVVVIIVLYKNGIVKIVRKNPKVRRHTDADLEIVSKSLSM